MVYPVFPIPRFKKDPQNRFFYGENPYDVVMDKQKKSYSKPTTIDSAVKVTLSPSALVHSQK